MNKYQKELKKLEGREPTYVNEYGARYYGELLNGVPNGKGVTITKMGAIKKGKWLNGNFSKGIHFKNDGSYFKGNFKGDEGAYHGKGAQYYANGKIFRKGVWKEGLYQNKVKKNRMAFILSLSKMIPVIGISFATLVLVLQFFKIDNALKDFIDQAFSRGKTVIESGDTENSQGLTESGSTLKAVNKKEALQTLDNWEVELLSCEITKRIEVGGFASYSIEEKENTYIIIGVKIKNIGKEYDYFLPSIVYSNDIRAKLLYNDDYEIRSTRLLWDEDIHSIGLNPLSTAKGAIVFEASQKIADDSFVFQLVKGDSKINFKIE